MYKINYLLILAGMMYTFIGCVQMPDEIKEIDNSGPVFFMKGQIIGKKVNQDYKSDLTEQQLCGLFTPYTTEPIQTVTFEEESGYTYIRGYDGTSNIYRNLELDHDGYLRLLGGGKRCKGSGCSDCTLSGEVNCICVGVGDDSDCEYSDIKDPTI